MRFCTTDEQEVTVTATPAIVTVKAEEPASVATINLVNGSSVLKSVEYNSLEAALADSYNLALVKIDNKFVDPHVVLNKDVTLTADAAVDPFTTLELGDYTIDTAGYTLSINGDGTITSNTRLTAFDGNPFVDEAVTDGVYKYNSNVQMTLNAYNLTITDQIFINFKAKHSISYSGNVEYGLDYYKETNPSDIKTVLKTDFNSDSTDKRFSARSEGIPAKEMTDTITAKFWAKTTVDGKEYYAYSNSVDYSVYKYAQQMIDDSEGLHNLLVSLLNYGAAFQKFKAYNTDKLANDFLDESEKVLPTVEELQADADAWISPLEVPNLSDFSPAAIFVKNKSLELLDVININYKLNKAPAAGDTHKMCVWTKAEYLELTKNAATDAEKAAALTLENCNNIIEPDGNVFVVEGIASKKYADTIVTRQVCIKADGTVEYDWLWSYSPIKYCIDTLTDNNAQYDNIRETCRALMVFAKNARAYFNYTIDS